MYIYKGDGDYEHVQSGIDRGRGGIPAKLPLMQSFTFQKKIINLKHESDDAVDGCDDVVLLQCGTEAEMRLQ